MSDLDFGGGWLFGVASKGSSLPGFDDSAFATVTLPHTVAPLSWQQLGPVLLGTRMGVPEAL